MMRLVPLALVVGVLAVTAGGCGRSGSTPSPLVVGAVEDAAKSGDPDAKMALARRAGYRAVVLSSVWSPPLEAPPPAELRALQGAAAAASAAGIRPIVAVYSFSAVTPTSPEARAQFATYAASLARAIPTVRDVIVGNEPNLNLFWMPQFAADGSNAAAAVIPCSARGVLRRAQAGLAGAHRDRRLVVGTRQRRSRGSAVDPFADPLHPGSRRRVPCLRAGRPGDGHVLASSLPGELQHPTRLHSPEEHLDRHCGLRQARRAARRSLRRYRAAGLVTADRLRRVRPPNGDPAGEGQRVFRSRAAHDEADRRGGSRSGVRRRDRPRRLPTDGRDAALLPRSDEPQLERLQTGVFYADDTPKAGLERVAEAAHAAALDKISCD